MGFVSLGQYLDANQGTLGAGFDQAQKDAQDIGGKVDAWQKGANEAAYTQSAGKRPQKPQDAEGYQSAIGDAMKAQEMGRSFGSESALAGSGRFGKGGEGAFSSALSYAKYGPQYGELSGYLDKHGPGKVDKGLNDAAASGSHQYVNPMPRVPTLTPKPPGPEPEKPKNAMDSSERHYESGDWVPDRRSEGHYDDNGNWVPTAKPQGPGDGY